MKTKEEGGATCIHCGSKNTEWKNDSCYDDNSDEANTSNHLVNYQYLYCNDCGETTG